MKTHVILRTCDIRQVHVDWRKRYCGYNKTQIIQTCVTSLVRSIQHAKNHHIELTVLDDHSNDETVEFLTQLISPVGGTLIPMQAHGNNHSLHEQFLMCRDSLADLVYSVEDDYLHEPQALAAMINSWQIFNQKLNHTPVVLHPFDAPEEYLNPKFTSYVVHGSDRHWRTGEFCTATLMCAPKLIQDNWPLFECLALKYNGDYLNPRQEHWEESNTIWKAWTEGPAVRFNPIPSLALHMQFDEHKDPFIDWQAWWQKYGS